ncbi:MAG: hypothetical protein AAB524_00545 [Patescibacteria group bacterium]
MDVIVIGTLVIIWNAFGPREHALGIVGSQPSENRWRVKYEGRVRMFDENDLMPILLLPEEDRLLSPEEAFIKHIQEAFLALAEKVKNFEAFLGTSPQSRMSLGE